MQVDSVANLHVDTPFPLRGDCALKSSSNRPPLSRISTHIDEESDDHVGYTKSRFPSFGMAAEALEVEDLGFGLEDDIFKSASAPERTNAFPPDSDEPQPVLDGTLASSPAHAFLSMFSPPSSSVMAPAQETVIAGYSIVQTIGYGGFSTVKKGVSSSGEVVAIKRVRKGDIETQDDPDECRRQLENEREIWRMLNHEHILPLFAYERVVDADYFITLFCPAGSLFDILKRDGRPALPQDDAGMLFRQVVRGLRYLHETAKIVHGDIKLENVLVDEAGMCRIADFGLSKHISDSSTPQSEMDCHCHNERAVDHIGDRLRRYTTISHAPTRHPHFGRSRRSSRHRNSTPLGNGNDTPLALPCHHFNPGSLEYAAPELLSPPPIHCPLHSHWMPVNPAQDMWALGVLLYALLTGHLPFSDSFEPRLQMKILHGAYDPPQDIGHGAESVLRGCIERVVSERWTIDMVDDVAWGVGWGIAGDVSTASACHIPSESAQYTSNSRSRSRVRPYPEHVHGASLHISYGSDGSVFSSSVSRSRSRAARPPSNERFAPENALHSPSMKTTFSSSTDGSSFSSEAPASPPGWLIRGRRLATGTDVCRIRSTSHSQSDSHSRSHSTPESPATPPDSALDSSPLYNIHITRGRARDVIMPSVPEKEEESRRGRRRAALRREKGLDGG